MNRNHQYGEARSVLSFGDDNTSIVNQETLNNIFDHPDVKNRKIVTFSVIGAFRKGKSFILCYCLRYLYAHVSEFHVLLISYHSDYVTLY